MVGTADHPQLRPTAISLFSGAGGLDIGVEMAGFNVIATLDNDRDSVETLRRNQAKSIPIPGLHGEAFLQNATIIHSGVEDITPADVMPGADCAAGVVPDLVLGGPPCQPFSSAGKMLSIHDPRGRLFEHFVRLVDGLRPRLVLFENVRGLVTARGPNGEPGEVLLEVKRAFEDIGYATTFALLNAADYGSPQRRVRCFMMASRYAPLPTFPEPSHSRSAGLPLFGIKLPWVTLGEFLTSQPDALEQDVVRPSPALAAQLEGLPEGSGLKSPGVREATRPGGHWGYKQGTFIADRSKPARTVTAASTQDWVREADGSLRRLTWRECAGLQGFPVDWEFAGNAASRFRQIGNAVPTVLGRVLGNSLRESLDAIDERAERPESALLPAEFHNAIAYTRREHERNGSSRRRAVALRVSGDPSDELLKGTGTSGRYTGGW